LTYIVLYPYNNMSSKFHISFLSSKIVFYKWI